MKDEVTFDLKTDSILMSGLTGLSSSAFLMIPFRNAELYAISATKGVAKAEISIKEILYNEDVVIVSEGEGRYSHLNAYFKEIIHTALKSRDGILQCVYCEKLYDFSEIINERKAVTGEILDVFSCPAKHHIFAIMMMSFFSASYDI